MDERGPYYVTLLGSKYNVTGFSSGYFAERRAVMKLPTELEAYYYIQRVVGAGGDSTNAMISNKWTSPWA